MRILKFLLYSVVVIAIVAVVGALLSREALLFWGTSTVKSSLTTLQAISVNYGDYVFQCRQKGSPPDQIAVTGLQLRFINNREYVLELICNGLQFDPIVIERKTLPFLVQKQAGPGGIIWGNDLSAITLGVYGRTQSIGVDKKEIVSSMKPLTAGVSPQTTCQGRGFSCCNADTQFGTGLLQSEVNDCPRSCFASCLPRPVVLSFTTDPVLDPRRTITIPPNQTVGFAYVISNDGGKPVTVTLDFGDGQTETSDNLVHKTEHLYICNTGVCNYQVHLTVKTEDQIDSVPNEVSQLTVQVSP